MGYAFVLRQDQTDCAAAALATLAAHHGVKVGIGRVRDRVGMDLHGVRSTARRPCNPGVLLAPPPGPDAGTPARPLIRKIFIFPRKLPSETG